MSPMDICGAHSYNSRRAAGGNDRRLSLLLA